MTQYRTSYTKDIDGLFYVAIHVIDADIYTQGQLEALCSTFFNTICGLNDCNT
jgi:hypothetical protein